LVSLADIRYPVKDLWYTWSKDFCHSYIIYNYHPCCSVTRRFLSQRKVRSSEGLPECYPTFRGETDKPSCHTPTRVIIGILYRIFLHQTPSNRIPAALRQTPSDWIHVVLWHTPSDWIHAVLCLHGCMSWHIQW
jgi:hypothetical protein